MTLVMVSGDPGSGKTTGVKSLDPKTTYFIDCDGKGLSWVGWKKDYNVEAKNYAKTKDPTIIYKTIKAIHDNRPDVKEIVVDTISSIMTNQEMDIMKNPSRDQWADLAGSIYDLFDLVSELPREDLIIYFMSHTETYDVNGVTHRRIKTNGKKLSKINLNGFLSYNLYTRIVNDGTKLAYSLITNSDGTTEARSPMGMFPFEIENNLKSVSDTIRNTA